MSRDMEAAQRIRDLMAKPDAEDRGYENNENFCRWDILPGVYGGYDAEFDRVMLVLLRDLRDTTFESQKFGLATDIFREMLCVQDLCDYGSSPRVCFPTVEFEEILPELIARWETQARRDWGDCLEGYEVQDFGVAPGAEPVGGDGTPSKACGPHPNIKLTVCRIYSA